MRILAGIAVVGVLALSACAPTDSVENRINRSACKEYRSAQDAAQAVLDDPQATDDDRTLAFLSFVAELDRIGKKTDTELGTTIDNASRALVKALKDGTTGEFMEKGKQESPDSAAAVCRSLGISLDSNAD